MLSGIRKATATMAVVALALILSRVPASAQQMELARAASAVEKNERSVPASTTTKAGAEPISPSMEELVLTIKRLEERVRELEAKAEKSNAAATPTAAVQPAAVATSAPVPVAGAATTSASKPDDKSAVLSFFEKTEVSGF